MGRIKDIYTDLHTEQEITDRANEYLDNHAKVGEFETLPDPVKSMIRNSNPNGAFEEAVQQKFQHAKSVLLSKHKDYGPTNISLSPGGPLNGLRVRMWDKFARINNLIDSGATPEHESLKDSFLDMANYAIIAMLVLDDEWDKKD
jgi:hypothetical protein